MENDFENIVKEYTPLLHNFLARLAGRENARDLTQDVFIKAWKNLKKFDPEKAGLKTWLFTIARNTATDFLRRKKMLVFSDLGEQFDIADEKDLPDIGIIKGLFNELPTDYKTVLALHYEEDLTFEEIGKILDKPANTVKSWHRRAVLLLRTKTGGRNV